MLGHRTRTRRGPAWTVNSDPGLTPAGTVTRYTWAGPEATRVTAYAPGRVVVDGFVCVVCVVEFILLLFPLPLAAAGLVLVGFVFLVLEFAVPVPPIAWDDGGATLDPRNIK